MKSKAHAEPVLTISVIGLNIKILKENKRLCYGWWFILLWRSYTTGVSEPWFIEYCHLNLLNFSELKYKLT